MLTEALLDVSSELLVFVAITVDVLHTATVEDVTVEVIVGIEDCTGGATKGTFELAVEASGCIGGVIVGGAMVDVSGSVFTGEGLPSPTIDVGIILASSEPPLPVAVVVAIGITKVDVACCWVRNVADVAIVFTGVRVVRTVVLVC